MRPPCPHLRTDEGCRVAPKDPTDGGRRRGRAARRAASTRPSVKEAPPRKLSLGLSQFTEMEDCTSTALSVPSVTVMCQPALIARRHIDLPPGPRPASRPLGGCTAARLWRPRHDCSIFSGWHDQPPVRFCCGPYMALTRLSRSKRAHCENWPRTTASFRIPSRSAAFPSRSPKGRWRLDWLGQHL